METRTSPQFRGWAYGLATVTALLAVCSYYYWDARAAGVKFLWTYELGGYYDLFGRAVAGGHLYLPVEPSPQLLALPNPWDPAVDPSLRLEDAALFHGRYYIYHGVAPGVLLFAPWRLIIGHDLPENFALFLLCAGGFLLSCGAFVRLLDLAGARPPPPLLAVMLLALGLCQSVPFLLNRAAIYEVAIGGGYFFLSGGLFCLVRSIRSRRGGVWLAASGLMFGTAVACRPHLGSAGVIALAGLAVLFRRSRLPRRQLAPFLGAFALAGILIAAYNYARFADPFEFGLRYLLTGHGQTQLDVSARNLPIGTYFMLLCPPDFSPVFPWVRMIFRYPFNTPAYPFPPEFFIEPTVGALWTAPFLAGLLLIPSGRRLQESGARTILWTVLGSAAAVFLFLASIHFQSERYEVDFVPLAVFGALVNLAIHLARSVGWRRIAWSAALLILVAYSAVANLALGLAGPYNNMLKRQPVNYARLARWFSPLADYRPILNPEIAVEFTVEFAPHPAGFREPLVVIGQQTFRAMVHVEHAAGSLRIVSSADDSTTSYDLKPPPRGPVQMLVTYAPQGGNLCVSIDGETVLAHHVGTILAAPAQVTVGENRIDRSATAPRFTGKIRLIRKMVNPAAARQGVTPVNK